jgi:hypothetical protein
VLDSRQVKEIKREKISLSLSLCRDAAVGLKIPAGFLLTFIAGRKNDRNILFNQ